MAKSSPEQMAQAMIDNMPEKTGKSLRQWLGIVGEASLDKHGRIVAMLKEDHGVTHGGNSGRRTFGTVGQFQRDGEPSRPPDEEERRGCRTRGLAQEGL